MNVKAKYLKLKKTNEIFSPIVSDKTIFDSNGTSLNKTITDIKTFLDELNGEEV